MQFSISRFLIVLLTLQLCVPAYSLQSTPQSTPIQNQQTTKKKQSWYKDVRTWLALSAITLAAIIGTGYGVKRWRDTKGQKNFISLIKEKMTTEPDSNLQDLNQRIDAQRQRIGAQNQILDVQDQNLIAQRQRLATQIQRTRTQAMEIEQQLQESEQLLRESKQLSGEIKLQLASIEKLEEIKKKFKVSDPEYLTILRRIDEIRQAISMITPKINRAQSETELENLMIDPMIKNIIYANKDLLTLYNDKKYELRIERQRQANDDLIRGDIRALGQQMNAEMYKKVSAAKVQLTNVATTALQDLQARVAAATSKQEFIAIMDLQIIHDWIATNPELLGYFNTILSLLEGNRNPSPQELNAQKANINAFIQTIIEQAEQIP